MQKTNIRNKKAYHDYEILDKYTAGIRLQGTEVKSIRMGKVSLVDSWCHFEGDELFVKGMQIAEYAMASYNAHTPGRERKLLLNRIELKKLQRKVKEGGLTIITLGVFINEKGLVKLDIALARGKKEYDKRETIKLKDTRRDMDRMGKIK
jgi:SsrA-binding protein